MGFGFGADDEHINGIIRTLIDIDGKKIIIVTSEKMSDEAALIREYTRKLKTSKADNIKIINVDETGQVKGTSKNWIDFLSECL